MDQLALFPSASARPTSDDGQQGAANGSVVESDNDDVKVIAVVTDFAAFQNLNASGNLAHQYKLGYPNLSHLS